MRTINTLPHPERGNWYAYYGGGRHVVLNAEAEHLRGRGKPFIVVEARMGNASRAGRSGWRRTPGGLGVMANDDRGNEYVVGVLGPRHPVMAGTIAVRGGVLDPGRQSRFSRAYPRLGRR